MSRVALVGPEVEENLAPRYLAAPEVVALSLAFQWRAKDFLALAVALREGGSRGHITAGGHFGTFACREILGDFPELDTVIRQEAEETWCASSPACAMDTPVGTIPGLALRDAAGAMILTALPALPDLARLPWPASLPTPRTLAAPARSW